MKGILSFCSRLFLFPLACRPATQQVVSDAMLASDNQFIANEASKAARKYGRLYTPACNYRRYLLTL
jgi:hypothetical protein